MKRTKSYVAIDCRMLGMSGIGVYLQNILPEVIRFTPQNNYLLIGDPQKIIGLELVNLPNITIYPCFTPIYSVQEQLVIPALAHGAQLIWVPHYNIPVMTRIPVMATIHDIAHLVLPEVTKNVFRRTYARIIFECVRRKAKSIIFVSKFTEIEFNSNVGKPRGDANVVHNGVDSDWFKIHNKNSSVPYFIAVGNLKMHKRIDTLCKAFASVQNIIKNNLILVGKKDGFITGGQSAQELLKLAPGRITFTGDIDTPTLRNLVANAQALIFPSSYEGFGLPPLEAMAAGVPVVASNIPSVREVCGDHALYFEVDNAQDLQKKLVEMSRKEKKSIEFQIAAAKSHALNFTWQKAAKKIAATIDCLL